MHKKYLFLIIILNLVYENYFIFFYFFFFFVNVFVFVITLFASYQRAYIIITKMKTKTNTSITFVGFNLIFLPIWYIIYEGYICHFPFVIRLDNNIISNMVECEKLINLVFEKKPLWNVKSKSKYIKMRYLYMCVLVYCKM